MGRVWLDRYAQVGTLGEGGFGAVYEALDRKTGEHVALHPNLVRLDHLFEDQGTWLIAMELVVGADLLTHVYAPETPYGFDDSELRRAFLQIAEGLAALHAAGLLHRDLKPSNVRVTPQGRVVVLDYGLTMMLDQHALSDELGTIAYMAPEQISGDRLGPATDWYAFGVCLYEALTGFKPFETPDPQAVLNAKRQSTPPPPSSHVPGLPPDLDGLCSVLLTIEPSQLGRSPQP